MLALADGRKSIMQLCERLGLPRSEVLIVCLAAQEAGLVTQQSDQRWAASEKAIRRYDVRTFKDTSPFPRPKTIRKAPKGLWG